MFQEVQPQPLPSLDCQIPQHIYSIDVAAINNVGTGKYSDSITVNTKGKIIFIRMLTFTDLFQLLD